MTPEQINERIALLNATAEIARRSFPTVEVGKEIMREILRLSQLDTTREKEKEKENE